MPRSVPGQDDNTEKRSLLSPRGGIQPCASAAAAAIAFLCAGRLVLLAIGLNVGWIILNWREGVLLFLGTHLCAADCRAYRGTSFGACGFAATSNTTALSTP